MKVSSILLGIILGLGVLFSGHSSKDESVEVYHKTVSLNKKITNEIFQSSLDAYNEFYHNSCKQVKLKLGDISRIEQRISEDYSPKNMEVVYKEELVFHNQEVSLNVVLSEVYFYNNKKTSYEKIYPGSLKVGSRKWDKIKAYEGKLKDKSENLLSFVISKVQ
jgi:hypothetical protein